VGSRWSTNSRERPLSRGVILPARPSSSFPSSDSCEASASESDEEEEDEEDEEEEEEDDDDIDFL